LLSVNKSPRNIYTLKEDQHGKIVAHFSEPTATFEYPLSTNQRTLLMSYHVLICEDDKETQAWLTIRLQRMGLSITNAFSGLEAVRLACCTKLDLMLLDTVLPDVDSMAVVRKLALESKTAALPIVALAATEWIAERLSEVPIAGVIQKPINEQILENTLRGILPDLGRIKSRIASVLIYDDKEEICKTVANCLDSIGLHAVCASQEAAVEKAMTEPTLQAAVVVLRSGSAAAYKTLQRFVTRKPPLPVVAITDRLEPAEMQSLSAFGVHEVLVQPFSGPRLAAAVKGVLGQKTEINGSVNPKRVLLVEDAALAAKVMGSLLEHAGYHVTHAPDAENALRLLHQQQLEFMLLDVILPGMDGVEFVHQIQQSDLHIPFAVVTGVHDPRRMSALQSMGALRVFEKPIHSEELLGFMDNYFARNEQTPIR
jgi:DNA-binding response OmpR family regulator